MQIWKHNKLLQQEVLCILQQMKQLKKHEQKLFLHLNLYDQTRYINFLIVLIGMMNLEKYNLDFNFHGKNLIHLYPFISCALVTIG